MDDILETPEVSEESFIPLDPEPAPDLEPAPVPDPEPTPEPEVSAVPVEVITVEDLLNRIIGESQEAGEPGETEEPETEGEAEDPAESGEELSQEGAALEGPFEVIGMDAALKRLETIQGAVDHPMLETPFEDYTVTEGLLLLVFVILLLDFFLNLLRRWF